MNNQNNDVNSENIFNFQPLPQNQGPSNAVPGNTQPVQQPQVNANPTVQGINNNLNTNTSIPSTPAGPNIGQPNPNNPSENKSKGFIVAIIAIISLVVIVALVLNSTKSNTNTTPSNSNSNNSSQSSSSDDIVPLNTYSNIDKNVKMKVTKAEPEPEDSTGSSMYYNIYLSIKNEGSEKVLIAHTTGTNKANFVRFTGSFVSKNADLQNLTESDVKEHPCSVRKITFANGNVTEVTSSIKDDIYISSGEEISVMLTCAITGEGHAKGVIPVVLTTHNLDNSITKYFNLTN